MAEKYRLPRADYPEEVGVSGVEIEKFLIDIEENDYNIHSFMVLRHGKVAAECYRAPFTADRPHALYSVSKTFTAVAVGIAVGEGLLSPDDKVKDFFPEYTENLHDKYLDALADISIEEMEPRKDIYAIREFLEKPIEDLYWDMSISERRQFWRGIIDHISFDRERNISVHYLRHDLC